MRGKYLRGLGSFLLAALLLPGMITLLSSTTAQAQRRVVIVRTYRPFYRPFYYRDPFWDPYWYDRSSYYNEYVFSSSQRAVNQGYHDGLKTGQSDAEHRRSYDPERSHYFHDAGFGNYASAYREGFARGYSDGFRS
jgi:hypothetical protein